LIFNKKLKSILKFLNITKSNIPNENSNPAKASKKKDIENKFISSTILPLMMVIVYKITHINSEISKIDKKLYLLNTKINIDIQKKVFQKINHDCILILYNYNSIDSLKLAITWSSKKL